MRESFLIMVLAVAVPCHAISRVGPCMIGDAADGFTSEVPVWFSMMRETDGGNVVIQGLVLENHLAHGVRVPKFKSILVRPFRAAYPGFEGLDRMDLKRAIAATGGLWAEIASPDKCALAIASSSGDGTRTMVVTWGGGRGMVMEGPTSVEVERVMANALSTLRLNQGACVW